MVAKVQRMTAVEPRIPPSMTVAQAVGPHRQGSLRHYEELRITGAGGLTLVVYTAEAGSASEQGFSLLASLTADRAGCEDQSAS